MSQWAWDIGAGTDLKLDFWTKPSPSHPDSRFLVNSLGCLIHSDCFNPRICLLVNE